MIIIRQRTFSKDPKVVMPGETKRVSELSDSQLKNLLRPDNPKTVKKGERMLIGGLTGTVGMAEVIHQARVGRSSVPRLAMVTLPVAAVGKGISEYGKHRREKIREAAKEELQRRGKK